VSCREAQDLIHGYLDGELDLIRNLEIERHLQACPSCARAYQYQQGLRSALTAGSLYYRAPARLHKQVQSALGQTAKAETRPRLRTWRWLSVGASIAAVVTLVWMLAPRLTRPSTDEFLVQEVLSAHVRSMMARHLTDVASSDQHTVKPWFNGQSDFSPPVTDLTERGFPLVGGRLDYLTERPVAALIYRRQQHVINLFVWPSAQEAGHPEMRTVTRQGYHLVGWTMSGMTYWAVSDLNERELQEFVQLVRHQALPTTKP